MRASKPARQNRGQSGFTLVEMLTVMVLMLIIMVTTTVVWVNLKRGAEMRTAINDIRSSFALARQYAVLKKTTVRVSITNERAYYLMDMSGGYLLRSGSMELPLGVMFTNQPSLPLNIDFRPSGAIQGYQNYDIILTDILRTNNSEILHLNGLTGLLNYD